MSISPSISSSSSTTTTTNNKQNVPPISQQNESSPLLTLSPSPIPTLALPATPPTQQHSSSQTKTVLYIMTIHFLLAFQEIIIVAPLIALFERRVCGEFYGNKSVLGDERGGCKAVEVQRRLAALRGVKGGLDGLPVLLVAVPLGRLADRYGSRGRRGMLGVAVVGVMLSLGWIFVVCALPQIFPIKLVWLSSAILLCGGGSNSASAYMWAMASESIDEERRSQGFYYIFSAYYIAELLASSTASLTTYISPWIPCALALISLTLCLILLISIPSPTTTTTTTTKTSKPSSSPPPPTTTTLTLLLTTLTNPNTTLTIPIFFVSILRYPTLALLIQYASSRFSVKISTGAMFYTETAVVNIFLFLFLVPRLTDWVKSAKKVRGEMVDLWMVRASLVCMCVGATCIGLATEAMLLPIGVLIFATGFGSPVSALLLISHWLPPSSKATVFAAIIVLESIGHAVGDPALGWVYGWGLEQGGEWEGLGFLGVAVCYALAAVAAGFIRIGKREEGKGEGEGEGEGLLGGNGDGDE